LKKFRAHNVNYVAFFYGLSIFLAFAFLSRCDVCGQADPPWSSSGLLALYSDIKCFLLADMHVFDLNPLADHLHLVRFSAPPCWATIVGIYFKILMSVYLLFFSCVLFLGGGGLFVIKFKHTAVNQELKTWTSCACHFKCSSVQ